MSLAASIAPDAKPRRSRAAKSPKPQADKPVKCSVYLSAESAKRLGIHSTMENQSQSAIVEALIREHLRRWVVQDRGKSAAEASPDDRASMAESSAEAAA